MSFDIPMTPPVYNITPSEMSVKAELLVQQVRSALDELVNAVTLDRANFDNVVRPLAQIDNEVKAKVQYMALFQAVAPSLALRKASSDAVGLVDKAYLALFQNDDLYSLIKAVYHNGDQEGWDEESKRLVARFYQMFVDNGMELTGKSRDRFTWIANRLIELRVKFMGILSSDPGNVQKSDIELDGLPEGKLDGFTQYASRVRLVPLNRPNINMVLTQCRVAKTRQEVYLRGQTLYPENIQVFKETVVLRDEAARLLGFSSFASQKLRYNVVQSPSAVDEMLENLKSNLQPLAQKEIQLLQSLDGEYSPLHLWDLDYYHHRMLLEKYNVDHEMISEFFPAEVTIRRMMDVFEGIFGVSIVEQKGKTDEVWHPDVRVFFVHDAQSSSFLGYLYTDIYPRDGKYNHAANFNIYPGYVKENGQRAYVATALVCNVSPAVGQLPALLQHREVITIFHELGHGESPYVHSLINLHQSAKSKLTAMHDLLAKTQYAQFHGHRTARDFVEAPSQLLEFWCWVPECLRKLSCHYSYLSASHLEKWCSLNSTSKGKQPDKQLPEALLKGLIASKSVNQGILTLRQVAFGKFDMEVHNPLSHQAIETMSISNIYNSLLQEMTLLDGSTERRDQHHGYATTSHYMWGQEANYYSYLLTRIYAADIWYSNFRENPMSKEAGHRYRQMILEKGGSRDEVEILADFLGQPPQSDAYLEDLGVSALQDPARDHAAF